ncbi:hypothetical protein FOG18_05820 [Legionella israelensis]|uniref:hypothetical protein n=1 Tax=Legionella israelensis TaxID=454 RepID=UPI00117BE6BF|nr:hypothetical protein [Legionella israelensis]QDP72117.1 hypothetical protein FOG18_05820 [Legionella israelensis]
MLKRHHRYSYSPIIERPVFDWPNHTRLAFYIALNIEHFSFGEGLGATLTPETRSQPDVLNYAWRDYGNRVGVWYLLELFNQLDLTIDSQEVNDIPAIIPNRASASEFADMITDHFDEMLEQSKLRPLVFGISLHPYIIGQPFRLRHLRRALTHIKKSAQEIWITTPGAIAVYYQQLFK